MAEFNYDDASSRFKAICEPITEAMTQHQVPGVALGIVCGGHEFTAGFGVTNVDHPLPVDENTLFQIGSTTKTFTATAVMRLVNLVALDLDQPIRTYLPNFVMKDPIATERVTMRHLLTHTGGWEGDYFEDTGDGDDALSRYVALMAELPQLTPLGSTWSYNNAAFTLAGRVIEAVTGKTYEAALKELVLRPLGLKRSLLFPAEVMVHGFAVGHAVIGGKPFVLRPWRLPRAATPAGGIAASTKDQLRYARFHLGDGTAEDGTRVVSRESMTAMQTPAVPGPLDITMGLSWWTTDAGGPRRVSHGGGTWGQLSTFTMVPERKFALTMMTNSMNGGLVMRGAVRAALKEFAGIVEPEPVQIPMSAAQLAEYAGRYTNLLADTEITVGDDSLVVQTIPKGGFPTRNTKAFGPPPPPTRFAFVGADRIAMVEPPMSELQGEFLRNPDGSIAWFRFGGRVRGRE
ncbi:MAG TPA: serine hydrolase domain-containing protein [Candidatus Binataceae bacterium]